VIGNTSDFCTATNFTNNLLPLLDYGGVFFISDGSISREVQQYGGSTSTTFEQHGTCVACPTPVPTSTPVPDPTSTPVPDPTSTPVPPPTSTPVPDPTATPAPPPTSTPVPDPTPTSTETGSGYDYYLADQYGCAEPCGESASNQIVAFPVGSTVSLSSKFYSWTDNPSVFMIISATTDPGVVVPLLYPFDGPYDNCTQACAGGGT
jgi:hypothetical protein